MKVTSFWMTLMNYPHTLIWEEREYELKAKYHGGTSVKMILKPNRLLNTDKKEEYSEKDYVKMVIVGERTYEKESESLVYEGMGSIIIQGRYSKLGVVLRDGPSGYSRSYYVDIFVES